MLDQFDLFDSLPESRRIYLPQISFDDHPYSLAQLDIFLSVQTIGSVQTTGSVHLQDSEMAVQT